MDGVASYFFGELRGEHRGAGVVPCSTQSRLAVVIEASELDHTTTRFYGPVGSRTEQRATSTSTFRGHDVSLDALSSLITKIVTTHGLHVRSVST